MGNQACNGMCQDHTHQQNQHLIRPKQITLDSTKPIGPLTPQQIYPLTTQARRIYIKFEEKEALDSEKKSETCEGFKTGFYLLKELNACYHGQWQNDLPHGQGIAILKNGMILKGIFINGYCYCEHCLLIFPSGAYYRGNITNNVIKGLGELVIEDSFSYEGEWESGHPHGKGKEVYQNGDIYQGEFQNGVKQGTNSLYLWNHHPEYDKYVGTFINGKISGQGTLFKKEAITITGIFEENNSIHDLVIKDLKHSFRGAAVEGKLKGKGKLEILDQKQSYEGMFNSGYLEGWHTYKDGKGRLGDIFFYKNRKIRKFGGFSEKQMDLIIQIIEGAYSISMKHSISLIEIQKQLGEDYACNIVEPYDMRPSSQKFVYLEICEKIISIEKFN